MTPFLTASGRQPRGAVKLNGELIIGWLDCEVENNTFYSADTFRCRFAGKLLAPDRNLNWFSQQQDMFVEIFMGFPPDPVSYGAGDLKSFIYGQVDHIRIDLFKNMVEVDGRDLTRLFIDAKTTQKWPNQTSSQIATQLAQSHGLTADVTATSTKVGKYYEIDHVNMADARSEWDILNYLADLEGFKVWVRGQTLYFQPAPDPTAVDPYQLIYRPETANVVAQANWLGDHLSRALTVSRGIKVKIRSWNKKNAKGFTVDYPSLVKTIKVGKSSVGAGAQIYSKTIPNLTHDQALQYAQKWYQQLIAHEMKIEDLQLPGDNDLDVASVIELSGTGTAFDQIYFPDAITRTMSFDGGYGMTLSAKNHAPDSQVEI